MSKAQEKKLSSLIPDDKNMNKHNQYGMHLLEKSISILGLGRSILVDKNNRIIGGNGVAETAASLGIEDCIIVETTGDQLVVVKRTDIDLDSKMGRELALADNAVAHVNLDWDQEAIESLKTEWNIKPEDWGVSEFETEPEAAGKGSEGDPYTSKIKAPTYEIKGDKPEVVDLLDQSKTSELVAKIMASDISKKDKDFLLFAANRHLVFNYERIADFYAHSDAKVQELMEESALVIIDFDKAIENGYVKLTEEIAEQYDDTDDEQ